MNLDEAWGPEILELVAYFGFGFMFNPNRHIDGLGGVKAWPQGSLVANVRKLWSRLNAF